MTPSPVICMYEMMLERAWRSDWGQRSDWVSLKQSRVSENGCGTGNIICISLLWAVAGFGIGTILIWKETKGLNVQMVNTVPILDRKKKIERDLVTQGGEYRHERVRIPRISASVVEYKLQRFRGKEVLVSK